MNLMPSLNALHLKIRINRHSKATDSGTALKGHAALEDNVNHHSNGTGRQQSGSVRNSVKVRRLSDLMQPDGLENHRPSGAV